MFRYIFFLTLIPLSTALGCIDTESLTGDQINPKTYAPSLEIAAQLKEKGINLDELIPIYHALNQGKSTIRQYAEQYSNSLLPQPEASYTPKDFTHLSKKQINKSLYLTEFPPWAEGHPELVNEYYSLHAETKFDRLLCYVATYLSKVIIHGNLTADELSNKLNQFDIQKLLQEGPYESDALSQEAQILIYDSLTNIDQVLDVHLHNAGYDEGNFTNPQIASYQQASWEDYLKFMAIRYAAGMTAPKGSTQEARQRMHLYAGHFPKLHGLILPIHPAYQPDHTPDWDNTGLYYSEHSALVTASSFDSPHSELLSAASIHPFDPDWKTKMQEAHDKGIRIIKWMPPQSIPPDSDKIDEYYDTMKALDMVLLAHSGPEHAIPTNEGNEEWADWGNPLRFRKPLQHGVNVILAHSGHKDLIPDLDDPDQTLVPGYTLFIRLAQETHQKNLTGEWEGKLYGDLAAVTTHYGPDFIKALLSIINQDGIRLIYGTDFPFTNLVPPKKDAYVIAAQEGLLDPDMVKPLQEIRNWNPLLANYVYTKNLTLTLDSGETVQFPDETFTGAFTDAKLTLINREQWEGYQATLQ